MTRFYSGDGLFPLRHKIKTEEKVDDLKKGQPIGNIVIS